MDGRDRSVVVEPKPCALLVPCHANSPDPGYTSRLFLFSIIRSALLPTFSHFARASGTTDRNGFISHSHQRASGHVLQIHNLKKRKKKKIQRWGSGGGGGR